MKGFTLESCCIFSVFADNVAERGGALAITGVPVTVVRCTLHGNVAVEDHGAMVVEVRA